MRRLDPVAHFAIAKMVEDGKIDYEKLNYGTACLIIKTTDKKALDQLAQYL